jgi:AcrR family transcriptional regulator/DNA-binding MarR family transcriptional regulator
VSARGGRRSGGDGERDGALPRDQVAAAQRGRLVAAITSVAYKKGAGTLTVGAVVGAAGISRRTFYELFDDLDDCLMEAFAHGLERARATAAAAYEGAEGWSDQIRASLTALLGLFDEEPQVARLLLVDSASSGPAGQAQRTDILEQLARVVDRGRAGAPRQPPPLTAEGVVGGAVSVVTARLFKRDADPLVELVNPLMSMIVLPYLGPAGAKAQLSQPVPNRAHVSSQPTRHPLDDLPIRITYRTLAVLAAVSAEPGLSNFAISERAGINDQGQASRILARLARHGLVENTGGGQSLGLANAWRLTERGAEIVAAIRTSLDDGREDATRGWVAGPERDPAEPLTAAGG